MSEEPVDQRRKWKSSEENDILCSPKKRFEMGNDGGGSVQFAMSIRSAGSKTRLSCSTREGKSRTPCEAQFLARS